MGSYVTRELPTVLATVLVLVVLAAVLPMAGGRMEIVVVPAAPPPTRVGAVEKCHLL